MGFDLSRFVVDVDKEFQCQICISVLEDPIETPCEHYFCSECINNWLFKHKDCPVDRQPLTTADLARPNRLLRNLLGNLDIKCDFGKCGSKLFGKNPLVIEFVYLILFQTTMDAEKWLNWTICKIIVLVAFTARMQKLHATRGATR